MYALTKEILKIEDYQSLIEEESFGALVSFLGTVRNLHEGKKVKKIFYECYEKMALKMFEKIENEAKEKFPEVKTVMVHRIGMVELLEASILVLTGSAHRKDAYEANIFIMDRVKELLPIWKKEFHPDGKTSWVNIGS